MIASGTSEDLYNRIGRLHLYLPNSIGDYDGVLSFWIFVVGNALRLRGTKLT